MTEEEKNTVRSLREQGYGYKTISNITGIHRETIKSHLKRHPCEVGSAPPRPSQCQIKKAGTKRIGTKRTITQKAPLGEGIVACKQCGEQFIPKRKGTLFCCDECRHKWWGKNKYKEGTPHTFKYEDKRKNTMYIPWKSFEIKGFWGTGGMQLVALIINLSVHDPDNSCFTCT